MEVEGGCLCGAIRYRSTGAAIMTGLCHCRQCQYIAGGAPNTFVALPASGFSYVEGSPRSFSRADAPLFRASREFCEMCGTHLVTRAEPMPDAVFLKVGTLDDPSGFGPPTVAIFTREMQSFHHLPDGIAAFETMAGG